MTLALMLITHLRTNGERAGQLNLITRHRDLTGEKAGIGSWNDESCDEPLIVGCQSERSALGLPLAGPLNIGDVKNVFHTAALKWHPDKHQGSIGLFQVFEVVLMKCWTRRQQRRRSLNFALMHTSLSVLQSLDVTTTHRH